MKFKNILQKMIIVPMTLVIIVMSIVLIAIVHFAKALRRITTIIYKKRDMNRHGVQIDESVPETIKDSFAIATKKC